MMRGSTLLLHFREATHFIAPTPKRRSPAGNADLAPSIGSLLPLADYSSSSTLEKMYHCTELV
jgi:hypothetical protein